MTATALQRLLKYPHGAVFDKSPGAELALRLRHPAGASWSVADGVLVASAGGDDHTYGLAAHTVGSLAAALQADGFDVAYLSPQFAARGAAVLVEGAGDEGLSNGDHLTAFTSPLWAIMGGYAGEIREAEYQSEQALRQMVIWQSEGEWLDLWGNLYAEERLDGESDADYAPRIPEEAFRLRVNGLAIEKAIKDRTGRDVEIREPWKRMFSLDISSLSGNHHFPDSKYYSYFVIHPVSRQSLDWEEPLAVIERNRAAGIEVYPPAVEFPVCHAIAQPPAEYLASMGGFQLRGFGAWPGGEAALGVMRLDDNDITLNHPVMIYSLMTFANTDGLAMGGEANDLLNYSFILNESKLAESVTKIIDPRDIAYASVCLSDGVPLGDENAVLSRGLVTYSTHPPVSLSDEATPSGYEVVRHHERVERIMIQQHVDSLHYPTDDVVAGVVMTNYTIYRAYVARIEGDTWVGGWGEGSWYGDHIRMGMALSTELCGDILNETLVLNHSTIT